MKSHKYWSLGALFCMLGCIYSGIKKSMTAHKYFAYSSLICMGMSIYSGHKLVSPKKKKSLNQIIVRIVKQKISFIHQRQSCWRIFSPAAFFHRENAGRDLPAQAALITVPTCAKPKWTQYPQPRQ